MPYNPAMPTLSDVMGTSKPAPTSDSLGAILGGAAVSAYSNLRYGLPAAVERAAGTLTPEDERYYTAWNDYRQQQAKDMAPIGARSIDDYMAGRVGLGRMVLEQGTQMLPFMVGSVAGGIAGSAVGGPVGAIVGATAAGTPQFIGSNAARALQETGGITQDQAVKSIVAAPIQSLGDTVSEAVGLPGFSRLLGPLGAKLAGNAGTNVFSKVARGVLKGALAEATTETAQQGFERWASGNPLTSADAMREYVQSFGTAAVLGGAMGGVAAPFHQSVNEVNRKPANEVQTENLAGAIDGALNPATVNTFVQQPKPGFAPVGAVPPSGLDFSRVKPEPVQQQSPWAVTAHEAPLELGGMGLPQGQQLAQGTATATPDFTTSSFQARSAPAVAENLGMPDSAQQSEMTLRAQFADMQPGTQLDMFQVTPEMQAVLGKMPDEQLDAITKKAKTQKGSVPVPVVAAVEQEKAARAAKSGGAAPAAATSWETERADLFKGVSVRGADMAALKGASSREELHAGLLKILAEDDGNRKGPYKLAERLGIDLNAPETATAPAGQVANVAPTEGSKLSLEAQALLAPELANRQAPTDVKALSNAASDEHLDQMIYQQLAGRQQFTPNEQAGAEGKWARGGDVQTPSTNLESIARARGITDEQGALTDKGRTLALKAPVSEDDVKLQLDLRGLEGPRAEAFKAGATGQEFKPPQVITGSLQDLGEAQAAHEKLVVQAQKDYEAGRNWRVPPQTLTAEETQAQLNELTPQTKAQMQGTTEVDAEPRLNQQQQLAQDMSLQLDTALPGDIHAADRAALKQMIGRGQVADQAALDEHVRAVKSGLSIVPPVAEKPFTPAVVDRTSRALRDAGVAAKQELSAQQLRAGQPTKAEARTETNAALVRREFKLEHDRLRAAIDDATRAGDLQGVNRIAAIAMLQRGDHEAVQAHLDEAATNGPKGVFSNRMDVSRRGFLGGVAATIAAAHLPSPAAAQVRTAPSSAMKVQAANGNIVGTLQAIKSSSTNPMYRVLASKLLRAGGWEKVTLATAESQGSLYGSTRLNDDGSSSVELYGEHGLEEETVLHELIHAFVQQRWAQLAVYTDSNKQIVKDTIDRQDKAVRDFQKLWSQLGEALKTSYPELAKSVNENDAWAWNFISNPDEALSWVMTNQQAQDFLRSQRLNIDDYGNTLTKAQPTLWERFMRWVADLIGVTYNPKVETALDHVLAAGAAVLDGGAAVKTNDFAPRFAAELAKEREAQTASDLGAALNQRRVKPPRTVAETGDAIKELTGKLDAAIKQLPLTTMKDAARRLMLGGVSVDHIAEVYGKIMPAVRQFMQVDNDRQATRHRIDQVNAGWIQVVHKEAPEVQGKVQQLMRATEFGMDVAKRWEDQPWLHNLPNSQDLRKELMQAKGALKSLSDRGKADLYFDAVKLNEMNLYSELAVKLHAMVAYDPEYKQAMPNMLDDPSEGFRHSQDNSAEAGRAYWKTDLFKRVDAADAYIESQRGTMGQLSVSEANKADTHLSALETQIQEVKAALENIKQAPYFHLGRHGDQFASFTLKNRGGVADKVALNKVADALEAVGLPVYISRSTADPKVYMRFEKPETRVAAEAAVKDLVAQGFVTIDNDNEVLAKGGPRAASGVAKNRSAKQAWIQDVTATLKAQMAAQTEGLSKVEAAKIQDGYDRVIEQLHQAWLDTVSDTSLIKVMSRRAGRTGYNADMIQSFAQRSQMSSIGVANIAASPRYTEVFNQMQGAVNKALDIYDPNHEHVQAMHDVQNELQLRLANRSQIEKTTIGDTMRATANSWFLGMSPGYVLGQATQLGTMLLPELGKKHGYVRSAKAIASATGPAFKLLSAITAEAKAQGIKRWGDITITPELIAKAGLTKAQTDIVTKLVASSAIDIGSATRQLGQVADAKAGSKAWMLRAASAFGLYSEITTRLIAGLAAHDLYDPGKTNLNRVDYAHHVIDEAMLNYASSNTSRYMSKAGPLGQFGPMVFQFHQYTALLTQKLYREFHKAIAGDTKIERVEAAKFLAGHITAMTALAGTLGLPAANFIAGLVERTVNQLFGDDGDEPFDATAAWRNFLAGMFGKDVGEVMARGLPHALGADVSQRFGEQDLIPFSSFLTDRREIKDWAEEQSLRSLGASISMVTGFARGLNEIAGGNVLSGMAQAMPVALQGPTKAIVMAKTGKYLNAAGREMPIDPTAAATIWQALGINPADKAEYNEKASDQFARRTSQTRESTEIREQVIKAALSGDSDSLREAVQRAQKHDAGQPAQPILPGIAGAIQRRMQQQTVARATGQPIGVQPQDYGAQQLTQY